MSVPKVLALVAVVGLAVVGGGLYVKYGMQRDHVDNAKAGDCLRTEDTSYRIAKCADAVSEYKVLELHPTDKSCKEVAGASKSVLTDRHNVCLGKKDADPATAVNVAKEGDCLDMAGAEPRRLDCTDPKSTKKILKRVTDVLQFEVQGTCTKVTGANQSYSWDWSSSADKTGVSGLMTDVVLCLGSK